MQKSTMPCKTLSFVFQSVISGLNENDVQDVTLLLASGSI